MSTRSTAAALRLWLFIVAAAVSAAVLGAVGFVRYLPTQPDFVGASPADIAYYTAQLFVLDPAPFVAPRHYPVPLEIARFLAPATTILAVFGILDAACDAAPRTTVDEISRALHDRYVERCLAIGDTPAVNASLVPWAKLPRHLKKVELGARRPHPDQARYDRRRDRPRRGRRRAVHLPAG